MRKSLWNSWDAGTDPEGLIGERSAWGPPEERSADEAKSLPVDKNLLGIA